jgi:hypothetical protein
VSEAIQRRVRRAIDCFVASAFARRRASADKSAPRNDGGRSSEDEVSRRARAAPGMRAGGEVAEPIGFIESVDHERGTMRIGRCRSLLGYFNRQRALSLLELPVLTTRKEFRCGR